jgi:hypothetical protein
MMNLVSGFVSGVNLRQDRDIGKYIDLGKRLIALRFPLVLFLEKEVVLDMVPDTFSRFNLRSFSYGDKTYSYIEQWSDEEGTFSVPWLVLFEKEDLYFWNYRYLASAFRVETTNEAKDSLDYFLVQIQKLEWMRMAIVLHRTYNVFEVPYGWIDFGIAHVFGSVSSEVFRSTMCDVYSCVPSNGMERGHGRVRFASCEEWKPDNPVVWSLDIYTHIKWVMAGGVFLGWADDIERLAGVFYERCFRILLEKQTLMWEVNILALLWNERRDLFELFPCNHDASIVQTYGTPIPEDWRAIL